MHPIGNFAADDRSPELQVGNLSTISSADGIFIHHVLLQGKDRHLLGSALVRHTVPPCFLLYTFLIDLSRKVYPTFRTSQKSSPVFPTPKGERRAWRSGPRGPLRQALLSLSLLQVASFRGM